MLTLFMIFFHEHLVNQCRTFFVLVAVIQIIDFKGKNIDRNLSTEIRQSVMMFPSVLALLNHRRREQATSLNVSAPW